MKQRLFLSSLLVFFSISISFGQYYYPNNEVFGKNSMQSKRLNWRTLKSNNFEFNFYKGGEAAARKGMIVAEEEFNRITNVLGYTPYNDIKIYIYNNQKDLFQSNLRLNSVGDSKGGTVNLSRSRVQIPLSKDETVFKKDLVRYISRLCVYDMLYGNTLKDAIQANITGDLPEWFTNGVASYVAEPWDAKKAEKLLPILNNDKINKINSIKGPEAVLIGESIWNYIAIRYGTDNIANILNLTRITKYEYSSIANSLGINYGRFLREWREYYLTGKISSEPTKSAKENTSISQNSSKNVGLDRPKLELREGEIDTDNYVFNSESLSSFSSSDKQRDTFKVAEKPSILIAKMNKQNEEKDTKSKPKAALPYQNTFIVAETKNEIVMDPFRRIGLNGTIKMNDVLENHHLDMGLLLTPNFKNTDLYAEYTNIEKKVDFGIRLDRRSLDIGEVDGSNTHVFLPLGINLPANSGPYVFDKRASFNKISLIFTLPISRYLRFSTSPFYMNTSEISLGSVNLLKESLKSNFVGNKFEVVIDNTSPFFGKLMSGSKMKFRLENYFNAAFKRSENFSKIKLDIRHYQPIGKAILAMQFNYGQSVGNAPKPVVMGGVENWLNRKIDNKPNKVEVFPRDIRNLLLTDFTAPLRGFTAFKIIGNRYLVYNTELRIPLASVLNSNTNASSLKSVSVVPFFDLGTAWMGARGPFKRQNSLNTQEIGGQGSAFRATVTDFKNPFFYSYGLGGRAMVFGYQLKLDYAWGVEDKTLLQPILHVSVGSDF
jgi:hypothetical protein